MAGSDQEVLAEFSEIESVGDFKDELAKEKSFYEENPEVLDEIMNLDEEEIIPIKKEPIDQEMADYVELLPVRRAPAVVSTINGMSCVFSCCCGFWFMFLLSIAPLILFYRWSRPLWTRPLWLCASPPRLKAI